MDGKLITVPHPTENCRTVQGSKAVPREVVPVADPRKAPRRVGGYGRTRYRAGLCWKSAEWGHRPNKSGTAECVMYTGFVSWNPRGKACFLFLAPAKTS